MKTFTLNKTGLNLELNGKLIKCFDADEQRKLKNAFDKLAIPVNKTNQAMSAFNSIQKYRGLVLAAQK